MNADADAKQIYNIEGEQVALGPLSREHIPSYLRWINDFGTARNLAVQPSPLRLEQETTWYEGGSGEDVRFAIYELSTGRLIGNCGLHGLIHLHKRTEVGLMIGEADARGRGYGTEALRLLLDYCFTVLGLHSVALWVYEYNYPARRCYEKVGFREAGWRREARWHNGRFWDEIMMDILESEFESPVLKTLLEPDTRR